MRWLLKLYPRPWQQRYGDEVAELLAKQRTSFALVVDLLAGALDAHLQTQRQKQTHRSLAATPEGGTAMLRCLTRCDAATKMTTRDAWIASGLTIGSALVVATMMIVSTQPMIVWLTMVPGVLTVGTQWSYLRNHSWLAKVVLLVGPFLVLFLIGLLASLKVGT